MNKFYIFLANNKIIIESNIPVANEEKGQKYLKSDEFWERYINYLYFNYLINNANKVPLFSFIHLIEDYFLWCENNDSNSAKKFKILLIETIGKMYENKEIEEFLAMNKLNKIDDLFSKYEIFFKYGNEINNKNNKEIEIKIDDDSECNCELCKNDKACLLKMSEVNKKINTNVNVENILLSAKYSRKNEDNNQSNQNNLPNSFQALSFNKSKTKPSFESVFQYLPKQEDKLSIFKSDIPKSNEKDLSEEKKRDEEKQENFIELINNNTKLEDFFKKVEGKKEKKKNKNKSENRENFIELTKNAKLEDFFKKEDKVKNNRNKSENKSEMKSKKNTSSKKEKNVSEKRIKKGRKKVKKIKSQKKIQEIKVKLGKVMIVIMKKKIVLIVKKKIKREKVNAHINIQKLKKEKGKRSNFFYFLIIFYKFKQLNNFIFL